MLRTVYTGVSWCVTYVGDDAADDDLLLASGLHGGTEVRVVHGVDLTIPADDGDVGVHFGDLGEEGAVGTLTAQGNM